MPANFADADGLTDADVGGIIKTSIEKEGTSVVEWESLGTIDAELFKERFGKLNTDEIIVTHERLEHIKERHPEDFPLFEKYGAECVQAPDLIVEDTAHMGTAFMIKRLPDTNLNVVVRLSLESDEKHLKNSVMTFYRIRERNLKKLIQKNQLLYKRE